MAGIVRNWSLLPAGRGSHNGRVSRRIVFVDLSGDRRPRPRRARTRCSPPRPRSRAGRAGRPTRTASRSWPAGPAPSRRRAGPSIVADRSLARDARRRSTRSSSSGGEGARDAARTIPSSSPACAGSRAAAARVASVCTGAYVLAAAGLLDGRRATTHWAWCDDFAQRYPDVTVDADPIFVRDGNVWTSAGVTAGMDLALALVDDDLGRDVALDDRSPARAVRAAARRSVAVQRATRRASSPPASRFAICSTGSSSIPTTTSAVDRLAARVAMSPRHFARVFRDEVGCTPAAYVERVRVEVARRLLETTDSGDRRDRRARPASAPPRRSAARSRRRVGTSPTEYRDRFRPSRAS